MLGEWHGVAGPVMPVWGDVHRTCGAAFLTDEAPTDHRPRLVLGQGVEPDADHAAIATAARTLDVARNVPIGGPIYRAARWVFACRSRMPSRRGHHGWFRGCRRSANYHCVV